MSSESVSPKSIKKATPLRHLLAYAGTHHRKIAARRFNFRNMRVLTVTTAVSHIEEMVRMHQERVQAAYENSSPRQYLFTTHKEIRTHDVLTLPWVDATGQGRARLSD